MVMLLQPLDVDVPAPKALQARDRNPGEDGSTLHHCMLRVTPQKYQVSGTIVLQLELELEVYKNGTTKNL